jgi:hypothetical protein
MEAKEKGQVAYCEIIFQEVDTHDGYLDEDRGENQ